MLDMSGSISFGANPWNGFISLRGIHGIYIIERNPWNLYHREESMHVMEFISLRKIRGMYHRVNPWNAIISKRCLVV